MTLFTNKHAYITGALVLVVAYFGSDYVVLHDELAVVLSFLGFVGLLSILLPDQLSELLDSRSKKIQSEVERRRVVELETVAELKGFYKERLQTAADLQGAISSLERSVNLLLQEHIRARRVKVQRQVVQELMEISRREAEVRDIVLQKVCSEVSAELMDYYKANPITTEVKVSAKQFIPEATARQVEIFKGAQFVASLIGKDNAFLRDLTIVYLYGKNA